MFFVSDPQLEPDGTAVFNVGAAVIRCPNLAAARALSNRLRMLLRMLADQGARRSVKRALAFHAELGDWIDELVGLSLGSAAPTDAEGTVARVRGNFEAPK